VKDGNGNRYAEVGLNELPNNGPAGTNTLSASATRATTTHPRRCAAVNTNGTGGGTGTGCGSNPKGLGGELNFDVYEFYCPIVAAAGIPCQDPNPATTRSRLRRVRPTSPRSCRTSPRAD